MPVLAVDQKYQSIGGGVFVWPRYLRGALVCITYWHKTPEGQPCYGIIPVAPFWDDGWDVLYGVPLTLQPSVFCQRCGSHGWIRGNLWVPVES